MRALITGASGFTARYVRAELEQHGWEVLGLGLGDSQEVRADLSDARALRHALEGVRPQLVIHLAAVAFVDHGDIEAFYRVNTVGTRHLLAALADDDAVPDCVILASSANIYGNAEGGVITETTPPAPRNDYAVSKLAMEFMAQTWADRLPIVITRPFNYTGVGQPLHFLVPKIVAAFRQRAASLELGNIEISRDFSDVRAVAHAYRRLAEVRPTGSVVNICSGRSHSIREILREAESLTGHSMTVKTDPALMRSNDIALLEGSPARLRQLIGEWQVPPLRETLRWMIEAPDAGFAGATTTAGGWK